MKRFKEENIDYQEFKNNIIKPTPKNRSDKIPIDDILVENSTYSRHALKARLIKDELLKNECNICGQPPEWNGLKLVMVLDHINGINNDNRINNLRLLCPNCHSQTPTFAGRKLKKARNNCECGKVLENLRSNKCKNCSAKIPKIKNRKVDRPSKELLTEKMENMTQEQIGFEYGVSGSAVKKWAISYGIELKGRGYWTKKKYNKD